MAYQEYLSSDFAKALREFQAQVKAQAQNQVQGFNN